MILRLKENSKLYLLPAFLFLLCSRLSSQPRDSFAIASQFQTFNDFAVHEKIFAHTDKSFYIAGETIWLKTYVVYAASHQPADLSKVVYVELLDATSKPVLQTKLQAKSGHASGSLLLPAALPTGNYILRAYTMWMQNFDPQFFFAEKITVVNSFNRPDWQKFQADRKYSIELFPEGGHLVYGLENTVAFRIKNNDGSWLAANGFLLNRNNDTLANLESNTFGLGKFRFIPDESTSYKVIFPVGHNEILSQSIDSIDHKGYVMQLTRSGEDQLSVKVTTTNANVRESVYLLVHTRQRVKKVQAAILENGSADFLINERELGEGVSHITLFNTERQPVCERIYFLHPSKAGIASISYDKNTYGLRDQVNLRLQLGVPAQRSGVTLSMTVFRLDSINRSASKNISTYLWLLSDIGNDGELYKDFVLDSHNDTAVDLLMMTSGWRRYKWADVLNNKTPVISFLPEYEGHLIRARISNMPGAERGVSGYLSIPGRHFTFSSSTSRNGELTFPLHHLDTPGNVILQVQGEKPELLSPFSQKFSSHKHTHFHLPESWKYDLNLSAQAMQVRSIYQGITDTTSTSQIGYTPFYGTPYNSYNLESYTRFPTMEEVMKEFVSEVRVRKQRNKFQLNVLNAPHKTYFELPPLLLVDGVPAFDADKVMALDPLQVEKIDIIANKYHHAGNIYNGIVSYRTYKGDLGGLQLDPTAVVIDYDGLQRLKEFSSPSYHTSLEKQSRLPDFRTVLFWAPNIFTDVDGAASVSFFTGDIEGKYMVVVEGLGDDGTTYTGNTVINVSK